MISSILDSLTKEREQDGGAQPSGAAELVCVFMIFFRALGGTPLRSLN